MSTEGEPILVVDDERTVREIISEKLNSAGFHCVSVGSTAEALRELEKASFNLALADIRMPGPSGMELLREIRIGYPDTSVIMVTAVDEVGTALEAMRLGASDYIVKPFNLDAVLLAVERALETRRIVLENRGYRLRLEEEVREETQRLRELFLNVLKPIAQGLDDRDYFWHSHSQRALEVATALTRELSLPEKAVERIRVGMQLCDTGKVGVREEILHKAGPLSREEYNHVMEHPALGERLLSPIIDDPDVIAVIKYHHEHWDGNGLPYGLRGPEIPLLARIAGVADAYVAMTSPRPYRPRLSPEEARKGIADGSGTVFDPHIVSAFLRLSVPEPPAASDDASERKLRTA